MPDRMGDALEAFVRESNRIEGIFRDPSPEEMAATEFLLGEKQLTPGSMAALVECCQHGARIRDKSGMNVRIGGHIAPQGGPQIVKGLKAILADANANRQHPYIIHQRYESLHPFQDGNGRSGRALWAWQMLRFDCRPGIQLGFLHAWYYQSLEHGDERQ